MENHLEKALASLDREAIARERLAAQEWAKANLKLDWEDESYMRGLASQIGLTLASWWRPASETKYLKRALKAVGRDGAWFLEAFGFSVKEYAVYNPKHPAWVAMCNIIEIAQDRVH